MKRPAFDQDGRPIFDQDFVFEMLDEMSGGMFGQIFGDEAYFAEKYQAYFVEPFFTKALLRHVKFDGGIWEPACGDGTGISEPLIDSGYEVRSTDIFDWGYARLDDTFDFLKTKLSTVQHYNLRHNIRNIVTGPPWRKGFPGAFVSQALKVMRLPSRTRLESPKVAMLLPMTFLNAKTHGRSMQYVGSWTKLMGWHVWEKGYDGYPEFAIYRFRYTRGR